jgi:hypothetical protein
MTMTYAEFAQLPASEKVVLCKVEAVTQYKVWTFAGAPGTFYRDVPYFIKNIKSDGVELTKKTSLPLPSKPTAGGGSYYFDPKQKRIYVRLGNDNLDPKKHSMIVTLQMFFSTRPSILPYDLNNGEQVEWDSRIDTIGSLGQQLDDENTGIVLESSSQISLHNNDGFFDDIFDTLIWENQNIEFYSWSPKIPSNLAVKLFSGVIESKEFNSDKIVFKVKDFVYRLKNLVNLGTFTAADGKISDSLIGTPKRRIYGKMKQVQCVGIDNTLDGYPLTGTITVALGSKILTGTATSFLSQLSPDDEIFITLDNGSTVKISIESISSDTSATLGDDSTVNITNKTGIIKPRIPYRFKNRKWHLAGHKLVSPIANIVFPTTSRRFFVDNVDDFEPNDIVKLNGTELTIKRISGKNLIMESSVFPLPSIGDVIRKSPVTKVFFGSKEMIPERDWTLLNTTEAIIQIDPLAEFNLANIRNISNVSLTFTNGSRDITTTATIDLRTLLSPRDWIRKNSVLDINWYEILDVKEQTITLRTPFTGTTQTITGKMKNIEFIDDDSLITVNCIGIGNSSTPSRWIRTASDIVKHLVQNDSGFTDIDTNAFEQAKSDCNWTLSMVIPKSIGDSSPSVRDVITHVNESVFGSLYGNKTMQIAYSILNARKPTDLSVIQDHDIISWNSSTEQKIVNHVKINYRPFIDLFTGQDAFESIEYVSDFVNQFIGIQNTDERTVYIYDEDKARIMAQRIAFYKSLSNCKVTLKGKLGLALITVNDKMYIEFDRLFRRYGGKDNKKIAIVTGVKKDGFNVDVEMTDLGNIFNRVPSIAPTGSPSYATSTRDDAVRYGFIIDNDTLTPDNTSETDLGNNRIG